MLLNLVSAIGASEILYALLTVLLGLVVVIGSFVQIYLYFNYHKSNRTKNSQGLTGYQAARTILDSYGLHDVEVKKAGFIWAFIWGNSYSARRKTIYLRRGIINKTSITAVAVASQKAGIAYLDAKDDKTFRSRYFFGTMAFLAPVSVPFVLILGVLGDIFLFSGLGVLTIVASVFTVIALLSSLIFTFVQIPVEKNGVEFGKEALYRLRILNNDELDIADRYFKAYIVDLIFAFVIKLIELIRTILRVIIASKND